MMNLEVGDIVLCSVQRIEKTNVFVKIVDTTAEGKEIEGNIILSEIAPGRIRNIRDYVVPKKKIVCKILRISGDRVELSLRRVTQKETKEVLEEHKQEKSYKKIIESVLGKDKAKKVIEEIQKQGKVSEFLLTNKNNPKILEKALGKEATKKISEILEKQGSKKVTVKKSFSLKSSQPNGLLLIKEVLAEVKDAEIKYVSAGKYSIKIESEDAKKASNRIKEILEELEKTAKKKGMEFKQD